MQPASIAPKDRLIVALDLPGVAEAEALIARLGDSVSFYKIGYQLGYAGGLPLKTPFGTIYSTNITPDPVTGIGRWSQEAFRRAMREGLDREGRNLYPAFPYNHYTLVSDADDAALYAYLMTRRPASAASTFGFDAGRYSPVERSIASRTRSAPDFFRR